MSFKVVGIGEVLWDLLPAGRQLGGAPVNFAFHAHALGAEASVVTRVGNDDLGRDLVAQLAQLGIDTAAVQLDARAPTGTVAVELSGDGVPRFAIRESVAWDRMAIAAEALAIVSSADAVCFGSLAQRTETGRMTVQGLVAASPATSLRVFDVNLRQRYFSKPVLERSLQLAHVLKLNQDELPILGQMFGFTGPVREMVESLARAFDLTLVALTLGPSGSLLYQSGSWSERTAPPVAIVDTVGAGDAFTAALVLGLLHSMELDAVHELAGDVARYVCSQAGATPPLPDEFRSRLNHSGVV